MQLHVHHEIIADCKLVLEVLSFHMLSAWVKHQIVDIYLGFFLMPKKSGVCTELLICSKLHLFKWKTFLPIF